MRFDRGSGAITDLKASPGGLIGALRTITFVPVSQVVSIGRDVAVINDATAPGSV